MRHLDKPRGRGRNAINAVLALPDGILTLCCFAVPLIIIVLYSFWKIDLDTFIVTTDWNLGNYADIAKSIYLQALLRSLLITLITVAGCILLGVPVAYFIASCKGKLQLLLIGAIVIPFWTSFVVRTYAWLELLGAHGAITLLLVRLHLLAEGTDLRYSMSAVVIGMIYSYLPMMILPAYSTFEQLDSSLLEAAADLGKSPSRSFFEIVLPSCSGGIVAGSLLVAIPALGEYTIPAILGGSKTLMIGNVIASEFQTTGNYPRGAALSSILMLAVLVILIGKEIADWRKVR